MINNLKFIFALLLFCSCNNHENKHPLNNKDVINTDTCLNGFILIEYLGEVDHPVKTLLIRTDKKDTTYLKCADKSTNSDLPNRKFHLNDIISTKNEFEIIKNYLIIHNTKKKRCVEENLNNSQVVILIDKCDTLDYIVDRSDTMYFKKLEDIIKANDMLKKYLKSCRNIQERR
jgi:hypothetical protein